MVTATNTSATATTAAAATATTAGQSMKQEVGLNKDDFLKLFITQLKNQDPLSPQDSSQFITQMAQLTQVEQAYNTNTNLKSLITAVNSSSATSASAMIGRTVMAAGSSVNFTGAATQLMYDLPAASTATTIAIQNSAGTVVRIISAGANTSGQNSATWDGKGNNGLSLTPGVYSFTVAGTASDGSTIAGTTYTTGKIDGIGISSNIPTVRMGAIEIPLTDITGIY